MEQYDGVAILATNLRQNLDEAFTRRLQFVVDFPFPDDDQRRRIWEVCLPARRAASMPELDLGLLGRDFRLAGGNIRNVVLHAAFLAAARGAPIGTADLLQAVRREHQKMGKVVADADRQDPRSDTDRPSDASTGRQRQRGRMFQDLDATLQAMFADSPPRRRSCERRRQLRDAGQGATHRTQATLNLFLHEVAENRALRDDARVIRPDRRRRTPVGCRRCGWTARTWSPPGRRRRRPEGAGGAPAARPGAGAG